MSEQSNPRVRQWSALTKQQKQQRLCDLRRRQQQQVDTELKRLGIL